MVLLKAPLKTELGLELHSGHFDILRIITLKLPIIDCVRKNEPSWVIEELQGF